MTLRPSSMRVQALLAGFALFAMSAPAGGAPPDPLGRISQVYCSCDCQIAIAEGSFSVTKRFNPPGGDATRCSAMNFTECRHTRRSGQRVRGELLNCKSVVERGTLRFQRVVPPGGGTLAPGE